MLTVVTHTCLSVTFYWRCLSCYIFHYMSLSVIYFGREYCGVKPRDEAIPHPWTPCIHPSTIVLLVLDSSMYQTRPPSTLCPWVMYKDTVAVPCVINGSYTSMISSTKILQTFLSASLSCLLLQAYWQLKAGSLGLISQTHKPFLTSYW